MKTTVEIPDALFRRAKQRCADRGISLRQLLEESLRFTLETPKTSERFRMKPFGFGGDGQMEHDWAAIRELIYEGRGGAPGGKGK
jgi:hypothetical protein